MTEPVINLTGGTMYEPAGEENQSAQHGMGGQYMTDVFISYAREDQELARALATELEAAGYTTWWDTELRSGEDFYEVILSALSTAKAAIVIWSTHSVKSAFVRDEARYAMHHNKFIPIKTPELDVMDIPFGFQSQHTDLISDRDRIMTALSKLGVQPDPPQTKDALTWQDVRMTTSIDVLTDFIASATDAKERRLAAELIARLSRAAAAQRGERTVLIAPSSDVHSLATSRLSALLQGLTLRIPKFQLGIQGYYSAVGVTIVVILLAIALTPAPIYYISAFDIGPREVSFFGFLMFLLSFIPLYLSWRHSQKFFVSRNTAAAGLLSVVFAFSAFIAGGMTAIALMLITENFELVQSRDGLWIALVGAIVFTAIAVYTTYRNMRAAR